MSAHRSIEFPSAEQPIPTPDDITAQLNRILASSTFGRSERLRQFLTFVVNESLGGRAGGLKEALVAVEVFRRQATFDPQTDSVVRVEAHNLRHRLTSYYLREGRRDPVDIELPRGSYAPAFRYRAPIDQ
jgi:adenylate cyclase